MEVPSILFSAVRCGIKAKGPDLGLVFFGDGMDWLAAYTRNKIKAAHILYNRRVRGPARALLVVSGCANAFTGKEGVEDLGLLSKRLSELLSIEEQSVLFASTGVIGKRLPMDKIMGALPSLVRGLSQGRLEAFADSIMTTDTRRKIVVREDGALRLLGVAKGAGMIDPRFATMLSFLFTDCAADRKALKPIFKEALKGSFERISVDGDLSPNDTVLFFFRRGDSIPMGLGDVLASVMRELAYLIVRDGEGRTKVVHVVVRGARRSSQAERIARRIARSPLVKTAFFGSDPNVGRIVAALGDAEVPFDPQRLEIMIGREIVVRDGKETRFDEEGVRGILQQEEIEVTIDLNDGKESFDIYTTDLSYEYVRINASYRS
jgi:glutamate N-acetyltransferase/amino-acid N-acetyltransferase